MAQSESLVFRASFGPDVHREFEIAATGTLYALAKAIVASFDFDFEHAFGFFSSLKGDLFKSPRRYELFVDSDDPVPGSLSVKRTRAAAAFASPGSQMRFLFDYGDEWVFLVEFVGRRPREPNVELPRVLASVGEAPAQYGGLGRRRGLSPRAPRDPGAAEDGQGCTRAVSRRSSSDDATTNGVPEWRMAISRRA